MPIIQCYVDDETMKYLERASSELGREVAELAEAAISNAAIEFKVSRIGSPPPPADGRTEAGGAT
jgi:hypothetical protein